MPLIWIDNSKIKGEWINDFHSTIKGRVVQSTAPCHIITFMKTHSFVFNYHPCPFGKLNTMYSDIIQLLVEPKRTLEYLS